MVVEEEGKCVGNAEEAVDDALEADTSDMLCVRYAVGGVFIRRWVLILLLVLMLLLVVVSMMMTMMMMMVAIRQQSITGSTQERSHRQLVVKLRIRGSSHIHGERELAKGIGIPPPEVVVVLNRSPNGRLLLTRLSGICHLTTIIKPTLVRSVLSRPSFVQSLKKR